MQHTNPNTPTITVITQHAMLTLSPAGLVLDTGSTVTTIDWNELTEMLIDLASQYDPGDTITLTRKTPAHGFHFVDDYDARGYKA